jgi:hypothetical protein
MVNVYDLQGHPRATRAMPVGSGRRQHHQAPACGAAHGLHTVATGRGPGSYRDRTTGLLVDYLFVLARIPVSRETMHVTTILSGIVFLGAAIYCFRNKMPGYGALALGIIFFRSCVR